MDENNQNMKNALAKLAVLTPGYIYCDPGPCPVKYYNPQLYNVFISGTILIVALIVLITALLSKKRELAKVAGIALVIVSVIALLIDPHFFTSLRDHFNWWEFMNTLHGRMQN